MEKATLSVSKNKKGEFVVQAVFSEDGKKMTIQNFSHPDAASLHGKEVEVERVGGPIKKVLYEGKVIFLQSQTSSKSDSGNSSHSSQQNRGAYPSGSARNVGEPAHAPYNFIPLNKIVIPSPDKPGEGDCAFDRYHDGRYTGYIELGIETKTPLYIRDTLTEKEMQEKEKVERKNQTYVNPNFFSPSGKIRLPGSSLRGMIRTLVEMISYGRMQFIDLKKKYHFRSFADKSLDLRTDYTSSMMAGDDKTGYYQQVKAGYLVKIGTQYQIKPAREIVPGSNLQYARVEESIVISKGILDDPMSSNKYKMGYKSVKFLCGLPGKYLHSKKPLYYAKVTDISNAEENKLKEPLKGVLVYSGKMPGRPRGKHMHWVIAEADMTVQPLEFMEGVIENYKNDLNRKVDKDAELLHKCKPDIEVPCFYIEEQNRVVSFGHTGLFRLAYKKSVEEFLPSDHRSFQNVDIAEAVFGNEKTFASRVFFEDAGLPGASKEAANACVLKILSTPKPTTFQHYLEQPQTITYETNPDEGYRGLKNYNNDARLRGNKLYWHKTGEDASWNEKKLTFWENDFNAFLRDNRLNKDLFQGHIEEGRNKIALSLASLPNNLKNAITKSVGKYEKQHTCIRPIEGGKTFSGRIRFENLSEVELGALLFALELPEGCCHKLGMGKPLGLGSVRITPKLCLSHRKTRYESLFAEWPLKESACPDKNIAYFTGKFEEYVLKKIDKIKTSLWETDRMKELRTMLDFQKRPEDKKTDYMHIKNEQGKNEFVERKVLPLPTEVIQ